MDMRVSILIMNGEGLVQAGRVAITTDLFLVFIIYIKVNVGFL